jgi:PAS domain S-box-containing protein
MAVSSDLFQFFNITPDLVCIAGKDGYLKKVNNAVMEVLGYSEKELLSKPIWEFVHPDDRQTTAKTRAAMIEGKVLRNFENRYLTKNGGVVWLEWTSIYNPDKELVFAIAKDISKRKKVEKEIEAEYEKFKSLATHFRSSMEEDRKFLASELHEEMAQLASVIKMDIEWVNRRESNLSQGSRTRLDHAAGIADLLIATIRRINFSIGSTMLEHVGLSATLEWQCREFSLLSGVPCTFSSNLKEDPTGGIEVDLLRISQEALTSFMLNVEIRKVAIELDQTTSGFCFSIHLYYKIIINRQLFANTLDRIRDRASFINANAIFDEGEHGKVSIQVLAAV